MKKLNKKATQIVLMAVVMSLSIPVFASGTPIFVTGTVKLVQEATKWLSLLIPVCAALFVGYHAWQKSISQDDAAIAKHNKLIKNVVIGAVIATVASALTTTVLSFYS